MNFDNARKTPTQHDVDITLAKQYLASTDWYVMRLVETGKPIPGDVAAKRAEARLSINEQ
ncbi:hypothetical protein P7C00_06695 [Pseudomonas sp. JDS08PS003]|uniref:hypothetical protein n=1 Tax=Pseudomonas sp. JDS08PS003 TaxID=2497162 RepID=UPI0038578E5B